MHKKKTFVGVFLMLAILVLGVGYAAISNITLNITGSATASPDDKNFSVKFNDTAITVSDANKVTAKKTDDLNATLEVTGLTAKGDTATATYTIENASADLSASLASPVITNSNTEYFKVTTDLADATVITHGKTTTVTVTVELIKTPITQDETTDITLKVVASPVEP